MRYSSHSDTAAARVSSLHGRTQVTRPEDLVWPPPIEDLQAFSVIKVGEDDERAASVLIIAGVAASARPPQPAAAASAAPAHAPAQAPAPAAVPTWPRNAVKPGDVAPRYTGSVWSRLTLRRWGWLWLVAALMDVLF